MTNPKLPIMVPSEIGDVVLKVINNLNPAHENGIDIIIVAIKKDEAPQVVTSIHPDSLKAIYQWLADHQESAKMEVTEFVDLGDLPDKGRMN